MRSPFGLAVLPSPFALSGSGRVWNGEIEIEGGLSYQGFGESAENGFGDSLG